MYVEKRTKYEAGHKKLNSILKRSGCVFAMKHGGSAARLDVVHWPFLVDIGGKDG